MVEQDQEVTRILERAAQARQVDLEAWETALRVAVLSAGARALGGVIEGIGCGRRNAAVFCECGTRMQSGGLRSKPLLTILGPVDYRRSLFQCPVCEKARYPGDEELDGRSDLYSLGCLLYEMLVGEPPFTGPTAQVVMARRFTHTPPEVTETREAVSGHVSRVVRRLLARTPADRYATGSKVVEALAGGVVGSALEGAAAKSIAVLPFANMSTDPENEYFSDGITEEIINALTQLDDLHVAARTSSFAFKGKTPKIAEAFSRYGVVPMKADWTNRDDDISAFLAHHGKYGIPFYLLYRPGRKPHLFSELLTKDAILEVLRETGDTGVPF